MIDAIYGAVSEPASWNDVLRRIMPEVDAKSSMIFALNGRMNTIRYFAQRGFEDGVLRDYQSHFARCDPWNAHMLSQPVGKLTISERVTPDPMLRRTEFYNDFLRKTDVFYGVGGMFARVGDELYVIGLQRPEGAGGFTHDLALIETLFPHLERAMQLHSRFEVLEQSRDAGYSALNSLCLGVVLLDTLGRVCFLNRRAEDILKSGIGLGVRDGKLYADAHADNQTLQKLIRETLSFGPVRLKPTGGALSVRTLARKHALSLFVTHVPGSVLTSVGVGGGRVAVFLHDPSSEAPPATQLLQMLYGLTPAQAILAQRLAEGQELVHASEKLGISYQTARTHLREIFRHTGTRRQSELVRLLNTGLHISESQVGKQA